MATLTEDCIEEEAQSSAGKPKRSDEPPQLGQRKFENPWQIEDYAMAAEKAAVDEYRSDESQGGQRTSMLILENTSSFPCADKKRTSLTEILEALPSMRQGHSSRLDSHFIFWFEDFEGGHGDLGLDKCQLDRNRVNIAPVGLT